MGAESDSLMSSGDTFKFIVLLLGSITSFLLVSLNRVKPVKWISAISCIIIFRTLFWSNYSLAGLVRIGANSEEGYDLSWGWLFLIGGAVSLMISTFTSEKNGRIYLDSASLNPMLFKGKSLREYLSSNFSGILLFSIGVGYIWFFLTINGVLFF